MRVLRQLELFSVDRGAGGWVTGSGVISVYYPEGGRQSPKPTPKTIENALRWTTPSRSHSSWPMYHTSNTVGAVVGGPSSLRQSS